MLRVTFAVVAGFVAWVAVWIGNEKLLSAIWPNWFGAQQKAFEAALTEGGQFAPDTGFLATQVVSGAIISLLAGFLAALVAGETNRAPLFLGFLLIALGVAKAAMSWSLVPVWYHVAFTAVLLPMAVVGGKLVSFVLSQTEHGIR
jgi:hypothetical protein